MALGDEVVLRARADAQQYTAAPPSPADLEGLRSESVRLFEALPEPPAYRRAQDQTRERARELLPNAAQLLARLFAAQRAEGDERLARLAQAVEAHVRALSAIAAGELGAGDRLAQQAWNAARAVGRSGSLFEALPPDSQLKVFDRESGLSRYDARPESSLAVQLFCPNEGCQRPDTYQISPRHSTHRFTCTSCKVPFTGHFAELRSLEAHSTGKAMRYRAVATRLGSGEEILEFDDASGGELSAAPRDLIVLLYRGTGTLGAVENLTTGRVLGVVPRSTCFVATAVYGDGAPELAVLREWRDRALLPTAWGRALVRCYYAVGPAAARVVRASPALTRASRAVLDRVRARIVSRLGRL